MSRLSLTAAIALCAAAGTLAYAQEARESEVSEALDDIAWSYRPAAGKDSRPLLELQREGTRSTFDPAELPEIMQALAAASRDTGTPIAFTLSREAGALACAGHGAGAGRAGGMCRFDPDRGFLAALAGRGLRPERRQDMFALALVDARLASVDGLSRAGYRLKDADELLVVSALGVSPAFAAELRDAGLVARNVEDLVTARALEIDAAWVRGMAEAGYPNLGMELAIAFRALDVTPDYARRMARVMRAMEGTE